MPQTTVVPEQMIRLETARLLDHFLRTIKTMKTIKDNKETMKTLVNGPGNPRKRTKRRKLRKEELNEDMTRSRRTSPRSRTTPGRR